MLEQLDDVDWQTLAAAYGSARDVPGVLRRFLEPDLTSAQASDAVSSLSVEIYPEDTWLVEATAHTLPFMLELAAAPGVPERDKLLELVLGVVQVARDTLSLPASDLREAAQQQQHDYAEATLGALQHASTRLVRLLEDEHQDVRAFAALLVADTLRKGKLGELAESALANALAREPQTETKVAQLTALEQLGAYEHARPYLDDASFAVQLTAALCLIHVDERGPCFDVLVMALDDVEFTRTQFGEAIRFRPLSLTRDICAAGQARASVLLPGLLTALMESSPYAAEATLEPLLATFFADGPGDPPTLEQAAVLHTVSEHPRYFRGVSNPQALLAMHGLPIARDEVRALAERGPPEAARLVSSD